MKKLFFTILIVVIALVAVKIIRQNQSTPKVTEISGTISEVVITDTAEDIVFTATEENVEVEDYIEENDEEYIEEDAEITGDDEETIITE